MDESAAYDPSSALVKRTGTYSTEEPMAIANIQADVVLRLRDGSEMIVGQIDIPVPINIVYGKPTEPVLTVNLGHD